VNDNVFERYFISDNELCLPFISKEEIDLILAEVAAMVGGRTDKVPKVVLDLEHLQVLDYRKLPHITKEQVDYINLVQSQNVIAPEELSYLALRSLFSFVWDMPSSKEDVELAAAFELALTEVLQKHSWRISETLSKNDSLLPYWLRLSFLRVMTAMPEPTINELGLHKINCVPIKRRAFNATSILFDGSSLIGFNYALEPILKVMNRYLMHFFTTQHLAGEARLKRAWNEIVPVVLHFSVGVPVKRISGYSILFSFEVAKEVHSLTAEQIDFVLTHEIGHIVYEHALRMREGPNRADSITLRHEFEYQADTFAKEVLRSKLINRMRYELHPNRMSEVIASDCLQKTRNAVFDYAESIEAVRLLFVYMDFIEKAKALIDAKLGGFFGSVAHKGTHPPAAAREMNLRKICCVDVDFESERVAYARSFFVDLLRYVDRLEHAELRHSLEWS
jgi:hypothetical protein